MKRYNPFAALDVPSPASSASSAPELLGNHPNSFFAESHSNDAHPVIQALEHITRRAEQSTNSILCDQLTELMVSVEIDDTLQLGF
jgi:hypothetical protein